MCGRYVIDDEQDLEELNRIVEEISNKYAGTGIEAKNSAHRF